MMGWGFSLYHAIHLGVGLRTLGIAISGAPARPRWVQRATSACHLHLREIERAVHPTQQLRDVHIEGNLGVKHLDILVVSLTSVKKVDVWLYSDWEV